MASLLVLAGAVPALAASRGDAAPLPTSHPGDVHHSATKVFLPGGQDRRVSVAGL
ncbi:MAG: hypothetical protein HOY76_27250 [Streptomyces sp.]|nr:hypothetical protein [Streptomyces sp.]